MQHTERTQNAHTQNRTQDTTICSTEQDTENNNTQAQPQHTCSAHNYRTYSFDFIVEDYISKNSIIQLYTNYIQTIYILLALLMR